ncbi:Mu transposase C-terminal domain-containing protein (plasmid) [Coraliomargarita sp. W4R53]
MPKRDQALAIAIAGEVYELDAASTKGVTLVHRVTGERRTLSHAELANLASTEKQHSPRLLDTLPTHVIRGANVLALDIDEVLTGVGRNGKTRPAYDLKTTSQEQRVARKLTELEWAGRGMARSTFFAKMHNYRRDGLIGLVDGRALREFKPLHSVDVAVVNAIIKAIDNQKDRSTGTVGRIIKEATAAVEATYTYDDVKVPKRSTMYKAVKQLGYGKYSTGSAKTRSSLGNRPDRTFAKNVQLLPGSQVQIDTNKMDIQVRTPDGTRVRPLLSLMTDVHTHTIMAFTLRLEGTKSVDHTLLLAQALTPRANRPRRDELRDLVRRKHSDITLLSDEEYDLHAQAHPYIYPNSITVDRGADYISPTFRAAAQMMQSSVVLSAPHTPTSKAHVERQFQAVNTLFTQYLAGYVGRSAEHKGKNEKLETLLTLEALRELFEDWVISVWQNRPHASLRDSLQPTRVLSPNQKAAQSAMTVAQLRMPLTRDQFIRMLDSKFRTIQSTGVKVGNREYDSEELHPHRYKKSNHSRRSGQWEVKVDPYNPEAVWVIVEGKLIECRERGAEMRKYEPDFGHTDSYRALTAQSDAEITGTPFAQAVALPEHTEIETDETDELNDDDFLPTF